MKFGRFEHKGNAAYGVVEEGIVYAVKGSIFGEWEKQGAIGRFDELKALVPCEPEKVLGIGPNYRRPEREFPDQEPQIFIKPMTSLIGDGDPIIYPWMSEWVVPESELAVVIGRKAKNVPVDRALEYVFGYTCANDVTAKDLMRKERLMAGRSKIFDSFCPLGPVIATDIDGNDLALGARVNGQVVSSSRTSKMVWKVEEVVSFISCVMTLVPGDAILLANPTALPDVKAGDVVEVEIEGIGVLRNPVVASTDRPVCWEKS